MRITFSWPCLQLRNCVFVYTCICVCICMCVGASGRVCVCVCSLCNKRDVEDENPHFAKTLRETSLNDKLRNLSR